jgi:hypothetical protein
MLTIGSLLDDIQADYIPSLSELKTVRRGVNRVLTDINSKLNGITRFDVGLELVVAETSESVVFDVSTQSATPSTAPSDVEPGDVIVFYGTDYNNRAFDVSYVDATRCYLDAEKPVFDETVSCTYAVYRPWRKPLLEDVGHLKLKYNNSAHTIESQSKEVDFLESGVKAGMRMKIAGATEVINNGYFVVDTVAQYTITIVLLGKSGFLTDDSDDPGIVSFYYDDAYSYDVENHRFSLPKVAKEIDHVFSGNITDQLDQKPNIHVYDSDNSDSSIYSVTARNVYTLSPAYFTGAGDVLTFKVVREIPLVGVAYRASEVEVPASYERAIFQGLLKHLFGLPRYSSSDMLKSATSDYNSALIELDGSEMDRDRPVYYDRDYNW